MLTTLALCVFAFLAAFVDAIAGGGGLIQVPALLVLLPAAPVATVFGTAKIVSVAMTSSALLRYQGSVLIRWRATLWAAAGAFVFSMLGARAVALLPQDAIRPVILVLLIAVAAYTFARPSFGALHAPRLTPTREQWAAVVIGATLGFYDGFFGPGMGSFLIFAFVGVLGFDFLAASAAAKVINLGSGLAAAIYFATTGHVIWQVALPMAAAGAAGSFTGAHVAVRRGSGFVRPLFLVVVTAVILKFGWDTMGRWLR
ncbi:MAG: TSUP family transporter [Gemmatimonadota bacterium]